MLNIDGVVEMVLNGEEVELTLSTAKLVQFKAKKLGYDFKTNCFGWRCKNHKIPLMGDQSCQHLQSCHTKPLGSKGSLHYIPSALTKGANQC